MESMNVRTLFLVTKAPYPPVGGAPIRNWQNINVMMTHGPVAVFSIVKEYDGSSEWPPGVAEYELLALNRKPGLSLTLQKVWSLQPRRFWDLDCYFDCNVGERLRAFAEHFQPDVVIVEEPWLLCYLPYIEAKGRKIIVDNHNVEADVYAASARAATGLTERLKKGLRGQQAKLVERMCIRKADQLWVCSEGDQALMPRVHGSTAPIFVVPNGIDVNYYDSVRQQRAMARNKRTLLFPATFRYHPNIVAADWLLDEIYPLLKEKNPNYRLVFMGADPTPRMKDEADRDPSIIVTGRVPDVRPYFSDADVVVVPLRQGGGTRLKILEAFASERPVVSTTKGAEGLNGKDGTHLWLRDDTTSLVDAIEALWERPEYTQVAVAAARELVVSEYSWQAAARRITGALTRLW